MANGGIIGPNNPVGKIGKDPKITIITETGTFTKSACSSLSKNTMAIAAGGGGGGTAGSAGGGGGGAGGAQVHCCQSFPACAVTVTIGAGGAGGGGGSPGYVAGSAGSNTVFASTCSPRTMTGGGKGGGQDAAGPGGAGGSGGGGGYAPSVPTSVGGAGTACQGNPGGQGRGSPGCGGGGGGGICGAGGIGPARPCVNEGGTGGLGKDLTPLIPEITGYGGAVVPALGFPGAGHPGTLFGGGGGGLYTRFSTQQYSS